MTTMFIELEMDAINIVSLTRARVETVSETEAGETIDGVFIGETVDTVLAEEEMGTTANVVLTGAEMGIGETIDVLGTRSLRMEVWENRMTEDPVPIRPTDWKGHLCK